MSYQSPYLNSDLVHVQMLSPNGLSPCAFIHLRASDCLDTLANLNKMFPGFRAAVWTDPGDAGGMCEWLTYEPYVSPREERWRKAFGGKQ